MRIFFKDLGPKMAKEIKNEYKFQTRRSKKKRAEERSCGKQEGKAKKQ